jgi:hypothetical protein
VTKSKGKRPAARKKDGLPSSGLLLDNEQISFGDDVAKQKASDEELNSR